MTGIVGLASYGAGFVLGCFWTMFVGGWILHHLDSRKDWE